MWQDYGGVNWTSGERHSEEELARLADFARPDRSLQWEHRLEGVDVGPNTTTLLAAGAVYLSSNESSDTVARGDLPT
jgi:hypothetical protein